MASKSAKVAPVKSAKAISAKAIAASSASEGGSLGFGGTELGLATVQNDLAAGSYTAALDGLLRAWERCKAAEIAALIDTLGAWAAGNLPPIVGKKSAIDGAFSDVADLGRPVDMPRLIAALDLGASTQLVRWFEILERFPVDPRLCAPSIDLLTKFVSSSAGPSRTRAFRMAEKIADGRCLPRIDKLLKSDRNAWNWKDLKDRIRKMRAKFAEPPALSAGDQAIVAVLGTAIAALVEQPSPDEAALSRPAGKSTKSGSGDALLAEVLANPDDDAARLVYADYLQQQGDERGELIALQLQAELTPAQRARVDRLLKVKTNLARWLGPLVAVVTEPVFERGFLHACTITIKTQKQRELLSHPLWSTVKTVTCADVAVLDRLKSLRRLDGAKIADLAPLSMRAHPIAIECLGDVEYDPLTYSQLTRKRNAQAFWDQLCNVGAFAKLRELGIRVGGATADEQGLGPEAFAWLFDSKLGKQLDRIVIDVGANTPRLAPFLPLFRSHSKLTRFELRCECPHYQMLPTRFAAIATRSDTKLAIELDLDRIFWDKNVQLKPDTSRIPELLEGLPAKSTTPELEVVVTSQVTRKQLDILQAHLDGVLTKFSSITVAG